MYKQKNYSQLLNEIESNSKIKSLIVKTEVSARRKKKENCDIHSIWGGTKNFGPP